MTSRRQALLDEFGIDPQVLAARGLIVHDEADVLVVAETAANGREHYLTPHAARAWHALRRHASAAGIELSIISAFRNIDHQAGIIRRKREAGSTLDDILAVCAAPGYSEHHTGRAVDIGTPGAPSLEVEFDQTRAFAWLTTHAEHFGFRLSYPEGNAFGFRYEPWHWCYASSGDIAALPAFL